MSAFAPSVAPSSAAVSSEMRRVAPRLRITRRGQVALATVLAVPSVAVIAAMALSGGSAVASSERGSVSEFSYVTISAGESLWDVAERVAPAMDPREVIADIERLNGLESSAVAAGESLAIPADYTN